MSRLLNRLQGRVFGWFDSKDARPMGRRLPAKFAPRARLALLDLEERAVPATFTVTNTADSGAGSLRQAITDASAAAGADTIVFSNSTAGGAIDFTTTTNTINLLTALAPSTTAGQFLTITGPGADRLTLTSSVSGTRPFTLGGANEFTITDMAMKGFTGTIANGTVIGFNTSNTAASKLTLNRVVVSGNSGASAAIYLSNGIHNILNSTISGNTSTSGTGGGAIRSLGATATTTLTVDNSTLAFNTAVNGGGICFTSMTGTVNVTNSTIVFNNANTTATTAGSGGGGINRNNTTAATLNISGSIIAGNTTPASPANSDISSGGTLLVGTIANNLTGLTNINGTAAGAAVSPLLSALGLNGGTTLTMIPLAGSPALDLYSPGVASLDQRGKTRPATNADAGAVERQAAEPPVFIAPILPTVSADNASTNPYVISITFADVNTSTFDNSDIRVTGPNGFNALATFDSFTGNSTSATAKYILTPAVNVAAGWDASDNGTYTVAIEANQIKSLDNLQSVNAQSIGSFRVAIPTTFFVSNTNDSGAGSLRQAIIDSNTNVGAADKIEFDGSFQSAKVINILTALPTISESVTINGPGSALLTVRRDATVTTAMNLLPMADATGVATIAVSGITFFSLNTVASSPAITTSDETVTLTDITVTGVTTTTAGAAISVGAGKVTLNSVVLSGNTTTSTGGGIHAVGGATLVIDKSTIANNVATGAGGGINFVNSATGQSLTLTNSTISGNTAKSTTANYGGGGISFPGSTGAAGFLVRNSTIAFNSASGSGGGIVFRALNGNLNPNVFIQNSTIANNTAAATSATQGQGGGGISVSTIGATPPTLDLESTIVSGNVSGNANSDLSVIATATFEATFSAISDSDGFTLNGSSGNNLSGGSELPAALKLGTFGLNNGGKTATFPILAGSSAVGAGSNPSSPTAALTTDQNGNPRVQPVGTGVIDIGATERIIGTPSATSGTFVNVNANIPGVNNPYTFTVTYADDTAISRATIGNAPDDDILVSKVGGVFSVIATFVSADSAVDAPTITATYSFVPPGGTWDPTDNGTYTVSLLANGVKNSASVAVPATTVGSFLTNFPATFTVTNTNDSGAGSLRQAILDANANSGAADTIAFDTAVTFATPQTITLATEIPVTDAFNINGLTGNGGRITISGGGVTRLFNINMPGTQTVNFSNLNLANASSATRGGAILFRQDILNLTDVDITGNTNSGNGGAIGGDAGGSNVLNLTRVVASNNKAATGGFVDLGGGGGTISLTNSTISNNTATSGAGAFAIPFVTLTVTGSTISGNSAAGSGGAFQFPNGANVNIINSTISGNTTAGASAGGAMNFASTATYAVNLNIRNSTITLNNSTTTGASVSGGINWMNTNAASTVTINSTIIAGNLIASTSAAASPDLRFSAAKDVAGDNNLVGANLSSETNANFTGTNPLFGGQDKAAPFPAKLNPLLSNGGLTQTHSLQFGSPAIDAGNNIAPAQANDQRGSGFPREILSGSPDIGAFELDTTVPTSFGGPYVTVTTANALANNPYTFTVTFAVNGLIDGTSIDDGDEIRITGPNGFNKLATFVSASPTGDAASITATYQFAAPLGGWTPTDNGTYTVSLEANQVKSTTNVFAPAVGINTFKVAMSKTFAVLNTNDSGAGSLRQAVLDANASVGIADTIVFDAVTFNTPQTIVLTTTEILINDPLTITGHGKSLVTVSGNNARRIFNINDSLNGTAIAVTITDMTLSDGSFAGLGGAVSIQDENVTFNRTIFSGNTATTGGGAINVVTPFNTTLTILNSTFSNNRATTAASGDGAAIRMAGPAAGNIGHLIVDSSTFSGNTAADDGGAIFLATRTSLLLTNSTISGNIVGVTSTGSTSTTPDGAAIYFTGIVGTPGFNILNSTISGNTAGGGAGNTSSVSSALGLPLVNGIVTIQNSTIVNNTASSKSTDAFDGGGGIAISNATSATGQLVLESTVVAQNVSDNGHPDISAQAGVNYTFSAIGTNSFTDGVTVNDNVPFGVPLFLAPLANNGGPTQTHAILSGSPLTGAGVNTVPGQTFDQRGVGFPRLAGTAVDIGAVERTPGPPAAIVNSLPTVIADLPPTNNPYTFTVSYGDDIAISRATIGNLPDDDITISRVGGGFTVKATFVEADSAVDAKAITAKYSFVPPGGTWDSVDNGIYEVILGAGTVTNSSTVAIASGTLGTFTVNAAAPAATAVAATVTVDDVTTNPYKFTVTYTDANAIDTSSIENNSNAVRVTGPNGFNVAATFVSIDNATNGTPRTVTYQITPPVNGAAGWDISDDGVYSIVVQANQAKNLQSTFVPAGVVGGFNVAFGGNFVVTNTANSGFGSLRDAVILANTLAGPNTISFSTAFNTPQTITLTSGELAINEATTITGKGAALTTVTTTGGRVFNTSGGAAATAITISGLTISGGSATTGGNISIADENVTINDSVITAGTGSTSGGNINVSSTGFLTIDRSTISNGVSAAGGGIFATGSGLLITNSTLVGNSTTGGNAGGAIRFTGSIGANGFTVRNSTIAGNSSALHGAGIGFSGTGSGNALIENSTITNNTSIGTGVILGGGIGNGSSTTTISVTLVSSIVSNNVVVAGEANRADIGGTTTLEVTANFSAIGTPNGYNLSGTSGNNLPVGTNLLLGTLGNNGGPTQTISFDPASPLLNAGSNPGSLATDQRGTGFTRVIGTAADIGAFEVQTVAPTVTNFIVNSGNAQRSRITRIEVQFSGAVTAANFDVLGAIQLKRTAVSTIPTGAINDIVQTGPAGNNHITVAQGTASSLILTFDNNGSAITSSVGVENGSLSDGYWQLFVNNTAASTLGDLALRRLYGDSTSSAGGTVDGTDLTDFGNAFNAASIAYDFNNDGTVDGADLTAFGNRFGNVL